MCHYNEVDRSFLEKAGFIPFKPMLAPFEAYVRNGIVAMFGGRNTKRIINCSFMDTGEFMKRFVDKLNTRQRGFEATLICPKCNAEATVGHFAWEGLQCLSCKEMIPKQDWYLKKPQKRRTTSKAGRVEGVVIR